MRLILSVIFLASLANAQQPINLFSPESESALGANLSSQARSQYTLVRTPAVSQYVDRVGRRLTAALPEGNTVYRFTVVEDNLGGPTHEPIALPGGPVFIPATLIADSRSEDELAGMLAHAIAHVAARHATRLATRAEVEQVELLPAVFLGSGLPGDADARLRDLQGSFETEADRVAVAMLTAVGYNPSAFADYVARRQQDSDERVFAIRRGIQQLPPNDFGRTQQQLK